MSRLSVTFDGRPVYLYEFVQGSYEDRRVFLCVHREDLARDEIRTRVLAAIRQLPEEIEHYDYMADPPSPDLFEQALVLAGFTFVDSEIPIGLVAKGIGCPTTERDWLERSIKDSP